MIRNVSDWLRLNIMIIKSIEHSGSTKRMVAYLKFGNNRTITRKKVMRGDCSTSLYLMILMF